MTLRPYAFVLLFDVNGKNQESRYVRPSMVDVQPFQGESIGRRPNPNPCALRKEEKEKEVTLVKPWREGKGWVNIPPGECKGQFRFNLSRLSAVFIQLHRVSRGTSTT